MNPNPRVLALAMKKQTLLFCMYLTDYIKRELVITKLILEMLMDFSDVASYRMKFKCRDEDTSRFIKRTEPERVEIIITKRDLKFLNEGGDKDERS